ncbi:MAG TPA: hypothetical protein EYG92_10240 [Lutibacter sp.]|nr:hypothetical protein [Lutibacter sp.]
MKFTTYYKKKTAELGKKLGSGGEGDVYEMKNNNAVVIKLYNDHCKTNQRFKKLKRIIKKGITYKESAEKKIAMPLDILMDDSGSFVGYVMPKVNGKPIKISLFSKDKIEKNYPNLTRKDLVELCIHFLKQIEYLHSKNILIGDINPLNLLIDEKDPRICWIIDTDSFQVDEFPCPVGTDIFTPPRLQGVNFKNVLRKKEDEYFSMAIMLFMILMPGKHPYSRIGGESPALNIKSKKFPYKMSGKMEDVPLGYWRVIWSHFTKKLKQAFIDVFANEKVITPKEWINILNEYIDEIDNGKTSNLIYPLSFRPSTNKIVSVTCEDCGIRFEMDEWKVQRLKQEGKNCKCALCMQKIEANKLSQKTNKKQYTQNNKGVSSSTYYSGVRAKSLFTPTINSTKKSNSTKSSQNNSKTKNLISKVFKFFVQLIFFLTLIFGVLMFLFIRLLVEIILKRKI